MTIVPMRKIQYLCFAYLFPLCYTLAGYFHILMICATYLDECYISARHVATPVKHKRDIQYITCVLIMLNNSEMYSCLSSYTTANKLVWLKLANVLFKQQRNGDQQRIPFPKLGKLITHELYNAFQTGCLRCQVTWSRTVCCITRNTKCVQDRFLKKEAGCTLAALEFLIAWEERLAFALVNFSHMIM